MNTETPPPTSATEAPAAKAFAHQAAKASWAGPIVIFVLLVFGHQVAPPVLLDLLALALILTGIGMGIAALFGIRKHGRKGILVPALVGLVINGLLLLIFVTNFLAVRHQAMSHGG